MNRRQVLFQSGMATAIASGPFKFMRGAETEFPNIVDTNVSLFRYPFRRLPLDETAKLLAKMKVLGISSAFAGSFEGIFERDLASVNRRLAIECEKHPELVPVGSINPAADGWEDDLKSCVETHGMRGVRLHPGYHGYDLVSDGFRQLLKKTADAKVFVQIVSTFEDPRTQPENFRAADVDLAPLEKAEGPKIQILNCRPRAALLEKLAGNSHLYFDVARIDQTDGVAKLLNSLPQNRVLFGTHAPFLIPEASLIRVHESNLSNDTLADLLEKNATEFLNS